MVKLVLSVSLAGLVAVTALKASGFPASATASPVQTRKADPTKDLYVSNCQMCHGPDGISPIKDMSFVGRQWKTTTTVEAVKVITSGVPGTVMLPFEGKLKKEQITALARYVRSLDTPQSRRKVKDRGQAPSVKGPVPAP